MSDVDDAVRRVQALGGSQMAGFLGDIDAFLRVARQVPYIALDGSKVEPHRGTDFVGVRAQNRKGESGVMLVTGGNLSADEARTVAKLLSEHADEVVIASPHISVSANIRTRSDFDKAIASPDELSPDGQRMLDWINAPPPASSSSSVATSPSASRKSDGTSLLSKIKAWFR